MGQLLEMFIAEEVTPYVRQLISDNLNQRTRGATEFHFEFNRFDLTFDYSSGIVTIADVLNANLEGKERVSLDHFIDVFNKTQ